MARHFFKRWFNKHLASGLRPQHRRFPLFVEPLEERVLLDSTPTALVVGRTLSAYTTADVQNNQLTITYSVYNEQADPVRGVLLTTTLQPGVTFASASAPPDRSGQNLAWSLGTIRPGGRVSVDLTVSLAGPGTTQLDSGAHAFGTLDAGLVSDATPAAVLSTRTIAPDLLAATPDANTTDPYVQEKAAELDYDPQKIFTFLQSAIGYNSYTGSLRGARGTLWSNAGNSLDEASLGVALLRASGIPAQYAQGTLSDGLAQQLIGSMFPASYQTVGFVPAGSPVADPAHDPQLLAETKQHFWIQLDTGSGFQDADPEFAGAQIGQAFTTAMGTFTEVPDSLRHKTTVTLNAEITGQASSLFGLEPAVPTPVLTRQFNDVDLVGHPLTFGNLVATTTLPAVTFVSITNTYSPYLEVGDEAYDSSHDQLIRGTDYQEVLTNFPLASSLVTGLFLDVTLTAPDGSSQTFERALVDRIGYATRHATEPTQISVDPNGPPVLTANDLWTLDVLPGLANPQPAAARDQELQNDAARVTQEQASQTRAPDLAALTLGLQTGLTRALADEFHDLSDSHTRQLAAEAMVAAYYDQPRLVLVTSKADLKAASPVTTLTTAIDLVRDTLRVVAAPGQSTSAPVAFNLARGLYETAVERNVIARLGDLSGRPQPITNTGDVFNAAAAQGIPLTSITPQTLAQLDGLDLPAEAKARITVDVSQNGMLVIVPTRSVLVNGVPTTAWDEINPVTGELIGVTQDGGHEALLEYASLEEEEEAEGVDEKTLAPLAGALGGFFTGAVLSIGFEFSNFLTGDHAAAAAQLAKDKEAAVEHAEKAGDEVSEKFKPALYLTVFALVGEDPPVTPQLVGLQLGPALPLDRPEGSVTAPATLTAGAVSGSAQVSSLAVSGQLSASWTSSSVNSFGATALHAASVTVQNSSGATVGSGTLDLAAAAAVPVAIDGNNAYSVTGQGSLSFYGPAETALGVSGNWDRVAATVTGNVSLTLTVPANSLTLNGQALPADTYTLAAASATLAGSGTSTTPTFSGSASVSATDSSVDLGAGTSNVTVGGAAFHLVNGVTLTGYGGSLAVTAGGNGTDAVTLSGSATNMLTLTASPAAPTADQNTPATFQANLLTSLADTYTISAQAPAGWTVTIDGQGNLTAAPPPGTQGGAFPIRLVARSTTDPDLIAQTVVTVTVNPTQAGVTLSIAPDTFFTVPANGAQIPTAFRALVRNTGPAADTFHLSFTNVSPGFTLADSGTAVTIPAGQTGVVGLYLEPTGQVPPPGTPASFTVTATSATSPAVTATQTEDFTVPTIPGVNLSADPTSLSTAPGVPVSTTLKLQGVGNVPETVALSVQTPAGVSASGLTSPVAVGIGQSVSQTLTLTPAANAPLGTPLVATVTLGPTTSTDVVSVVAVAASPSSAEAGTRVDVTAHVLNGVRQATAALASFTVKDGNGNVVFTSTPVAFNLGVVTQVASVDLGTVDTTGFAPGAYTITVTVTDQGGQPIAGATGQGSLFVHIPVQASLALSPDTLAPGVGTVTTTLTLASQALLGQVAIGGGATSVATAGSVAYVCGSDGIRIVDVSNPSAPRVVKTFGGSDLTSGAANLCRLAGNDLLVGSQVNTGASQFNLLIYSVADPLNPQLLGNSAVPYSFLSDLFVRGTTAFASISGVSYTDPGTILDQFGDFLALDIHNPASAGVAGVLSNTRGTPYGGDTNQHGGVAVTNQLAYVVGSTATGADTQDGVGRVELVNIADPTHLAVVKQLQLPGTAHVVAIALQGNRAVVVGSTGGWNNPFNGPANLGLGGTVTLTTLDISDPANPQILATTSLTGTALPAGVAAGPNVVALGNGTFAVGGVLKNGAPVLLVVDPGNPSDPVLSSLTVPGLVNGLAVAGDLLEAATPNGLSVYGITGLTAVPVTASVEIPNNTGVAVVPGSFSIPPTQVVPGSTFDTCRWQLTLPAGGGSRTIQWNATLSNLQAGEARPVTLATTVQLPGQAAPFTMTLPPTVAAVIAPTQTLQIAVQAVVPGAAAIDCSATAAGQLNDKDLSDRLTELGVALTNLVQNPTSATFKSAVLADLDTVAGLLQTDAFVTGDMAALVAARNQLAAAQTAGDLQTAVTALANAVTPICTALTDEVHHGFTLALSPNTAVTLPGVATTFDVVLQNLGSTATTYDFKLTGLPAGVTGTFSKPSITLNPGEAIPNGTNRVTLSLSQSGTQILATGFTVTVTPEGATELARGVPGSLTVRPAFVTVADVEPSPTFTDPGGKVDITTKILNAANESHQVQVAYTVQDPGGATVFTSTPMPLTLGLQTSLVTVDLGTFDTTGFATGEHTVTVTVADASGSPLPGVTGTGSVLVGSPVTATLTVDPGVLAPGTGTVTNPVAVTSQVPFPNPLTLAGQVQTTHSSTTVALDGNLAYVAGTNGIDIVDVSNPASPQLRSTFGQDQIVKGGLTVVRQDTIGGTDYLLIGTTTQLNANQFTLLVYSIAADPLNPQLVSSTAFDYEFLTDMLVQGNTVLVPTNGYTFGILCGGICDQFGSMLSIDVSNPAAPTLASVLFNNRGVPLGGDTNQDGGILVNNQLAYIASTTSVGADTQTGMGRILIVDYSNPANLSVAHELDIPDTLRIEDIAIQGDRALVVGSTGGWRTPFTDGVDNGLTGNLTLTMLDITDPANPQILGSTLVTDGTFPEGAGTGPAKFSALALGNGQFAVSEAIVNSKPVLLLVDSSDPNNLAVTTDPVPALVDEMAVSGSLLYTASDAGLLIYNIGALESTPVTISVEVPNNTGVTVVPGSFNSPPTQIVHGTNFDTLVWLRQLAFGESMPTLTWQSTVSNLQPGEVRDVTLGATVTFTSQGTPGTFTLPPTAVTAAEILSLNPASQTVQPGAPADYVLNVTNPSTGDATFTLSVQGVPAGWVSDLPATVMVGPGSTVSEPLTLTSDLFATLGDHGFTVTADAGTGFTASVQGTLTLAGTPVLPDPEAHGVVVTLTPASASAGQGTSATYIVQITNTGSADDTFNLEVNSPNGVNFGLMQSSVEVPPGASNFRDVTLTLTPAAGTAAGSVSFTVTAVSVTDNTVTSTADGTLNVLGNGVQVTLNPPSGNPGDGFQLTVTNTGQGSDTFDLALAGPAALVASLGSTKVTLGPGASQIVPITTSAVSFSDAFPLNLTGSATSETNAAVQASASADLNIPSATGMTAAFSPATQLLPVPGTASFLLLVHNIGNREDSYSATITTTTGPITASLTGVDGTQTQMVAIFILPGLSTGAILLNTSLTGAGQGTVTVQVQSLSDGSIVAAPTATVTAPTRPGVVQFSTAASSVNENAGQATITLNRTNGSDGAVSVLVSTSNGTATAGQDYTAVSQTVSWTDGDTSPKTITVPVQDDDLFKGDETVSLALGDPTGGVTLGSPATAVLTIVDNDAAQDNPGTLQFSAAGTTVNENGGSATITVNRVGGSHGTASVQIGTSDGTATAGQDYTSVSQILTWTDGDATAKTITIPVRDDNLGKGDETVNLALTNPSGAPLGTPSTAVLTIVDNDAATDNPGTVVFSTGSYSVNENGGSATITVNRSGGDSGAVSVRLDTGDGTGHANVDYTAVRQTLSWADGDTSPRMVVVPILDAHVAGGQRTVNLTLSNASGASLGSPATAVLTIADNDTANPGTIQFSAATYTVNENAGQAIITLTRTGGSDGLVGVALRTTDGTAIPGQNYEHTIQVATWANGDTSARTVTVPILDAFLVNGSETVNLVLTDPIPGTHLGTPSLAVLTILNNDVPGPAVVLTETQVQRTGKRGIPTAVVLTFSGPLNPAVAATAKHFKIYTRDQQKHVKKRQLLVNVLAASYDRFKFQVTLKIGKAKNRKTLGTLEILGLTDAFGRPGGNTDVSVNLQSKARKH
jgi:uncharacterized membrane protein